MRLAIGVLRLAIGVLRIAIRVSGVIETHAQHELIAAAALLRQLIAAAALMRLPH